jgi:hypothetical protein
MISPKSRLVLDLVFYGASVCVAMGTGFLLLTTGLVRNAAMLWPILPGLGSSFMLTSVLRKNGQKKVVFLTLLVFLYSALLLLVYASTLTLRSMWPLFVVATGIAVLPAGYLRYKRLRPVFFVPGTAFLILGALFSIFSFGFSALSFRTFVIIWWPGFIVAGGLFLFMIYFVNKSIYKHRNTDPVMPEDGSQL